MMRIVNYDGSYPINLHVLLTNRCNMTCAECPHRSRSGDPIDMDFYKLMRLLEEAAEMGVKNIAFGGGEPTLYPALPYVLGWLKAKGIKSAVTTNGTKEMQVYPDILHFSLDDMHGYSTQVIRRIARIKKANPEVLIGMNHVFWSFDSLNDWLTSVGYLFDQVIIILRKDEPPNEKELSKLWKKINTLPVPRGKIRLDSCLILFYNSRRSEWCRQGKTSMCIFPDMTAARCSFLTAPEDRIQFSHLEEAWNKVKNQKVCRFK